MFVFDKFKKKETIFFQNLNNLEDNFVVGFFVFKDSSPKKYNGFCLNKSGYIVFEKIENGDFNICSGDFVCKDANYKKTIDLSSLGGTIISSENMADNLFEQVVNNFYGLSWSEKNLIIKSFLKFSKPKNPQLIKIDEQDHIWLD